MPEGLLLALMELGAAAFDGVRYAGSAGRRFGPALRRISRVLERGLARSKFEVQDAELQELKTQAELLQDALIQHRTGKAADDSRIAGLSARIREIAPSIAAGRVDHSQAYSLLVEVREIRRAILH